MRAPAIAIAVAVLLALAGPAGAATCGHDGRGFERWLEGFKRQASGLGIRRQTVRSALDGITYDRKVVRLDRSQKAFKQSFKKFAAQRVTKGRLAKGRRLLSQHARLLDQVERRFGVPAPVLVAIWGLETDYGRNMGNMGVFRSLATLAYDCRRADFFRNELVNALMIADRGDISPRAMRGAWAGELGQTQFLASSYMRFAVDFDGDRRRDLLRSVPDVLASTANYLRSYGWRPGAGWQPGQPNYPVLRQWNKSQIYAQTIALMASRLAGH